MTRPVRATCGLAAALLAAAGLSIAAQTASPQTQQPPRPTFRAGTEVVLVDVYPQKNGQIVTGLSADDFQVFEDGKPQKVESLQFVRVEPRGAEPVHDDPNTVADMRRQAADPHIRVFAIFLDVMHTAFGGAYAVRRPLIDFLDRAIGPDDLFGAMTPAMRPSDLSFGHHSESIEAELAKFADIGRRDQEATDPTDPMEEVIRSCFNTPFAGNNVSARILARRREDRVLTSLHDLAAYMGTLREARTVVLVITDGWVLFRPDPGVATDAANSILSVPGATTLPQPRLPGQPVTSGNQDKTSTCLAEANRLAALDDEQRLRDIVQLASHNNVSFYPVASNGLQPFDTVIGGAAEVPVGQPKGGLSQSMANVGNRLDALRTLADATGGLAIINTNDLTAGLARAANDVSSYYLLTYYSTNDKHDGRYRRIEVKLKPPGLSVRARPGYTALDDNARAGPPAPAAPIVPAGISAALAKLRPDAPDLATYVRRTPGTLSVVAEIDSHLAARPEWTGGGAVTVDVLNAAGERLAGASGTIAPGARSISVDVPFTQMVPVEVRTKVTSKGAALEDKLAVVAEPDEALIGDPAVSRATPSPRSPLWPVAAFEFSRAERLHVDVPILGPTDRRSVRLLDRRGQPLAVTPATSDRDANGQAGLAIDLNLVPLADGDYLIEIEVAHGTVTDRAYLPFRIAG